MNNFKKLLAGAMALTMVTSVVPTAATSVFAASYSEVQAAEEVVNEIVYNLAQKEKTIYDSTFEEIKEASGKENLTTAVSAATSEEGKYLAGLYAGTNALKELLTKLPELADDGEIKNTDAYDTTYKAHYESLIANEKYLGNMGWSSEVLSDFNDDADALKAMVAEYKEAYSDVYLEEYVTELRTKTFVEELTALEDEKSYSRDNLEDLKETLEKELDSDEYAEYSGEDEVAEIIDAIETMIDNMETVNEILGSDDAKEFRKVRNKVTAFVEKTDDAALDYIAENFTEEDVEKIINYAENVVSEFYTYETRRRSVSGNYYVVEEPTELAMYLNSNDVHEGARKLLKEIFEEKVSDTYYDVLVEEDLSVTTKEELMEMIDAAKNIELKWNYTTSEAEKVWDAVYAVNVLLNNRTQYEVTAREARTLETLKGKLDVIDDRLGEVEADVEITKDWWVFENGQWVFYQDGRTVSNVWVADHNNDWYYAGANGVMLTNSWIARDSSLQVWYYVGADGKMVTNTVVDGYTIDANGEWHA